MESQKFPARIVLAITLEVNDMKKFVSELRGKTVMTNEGQILGMIENFVVDTVTGELQHVLVIPAEEVEIRLYRTDAL